MLFQGGNVTAASFTKSQLKNIGVFPYPKVPTSVTENVSAAAARDGISSAGPAFAAAFRDRVVDRQQRGARAPTEANRRLTPSARSRA